MRPKFSSRSRKLCASASPTPSRPELPNARPEPSSPRNLRRSKPDGLSCCCATSRSTMPPDPQRVIGSLSATGRSEAWKTFLSYLLGVSWFLLRIMAKARALARQTDNARISLRLPGTRFTQVRLADARIMEQRLGLAREGDGARLHHIRPTRRLEREQGVLLDQENGHAVRRNVAHDLENLRYHHRGE